MRSDMAKLSDRGWLEFPPRPAGKAPLAIVSGFRLAGEAGGGRPAFDTGWMYNIMTPLGIGMMLARFGKASQVAFTGTSATHYIYPGFIELGTAVAAPDYFGALALDPAAACSVAITSWILTSTGGAGPEVPRRLIFSASIPVETVCATETTIDITEVALIAATESHLLAASHFDPITISGDQTFTAFYSIGLAQ